MEVREGAWPMQRMEELESPAIADGAMRLRIGTLWVDVLTRPAALDAIARLVAQGNGGAVFTPNVDHIVTAEGDAQFRAAYSLADLCLADGVPVVWASRLLRPPLPEKLSGSDMLWPIAELAAHHGWRTYVLGGARGAGIAAAARLERELGLRIVGVDGARVSATADQPSDDAVMSRLRDAAPDLVLVGLGAPKQEFFIQRMRRDVPNAVGVGVGASLDFLAGRVRRAPRPISALGFEWAFRLAQEPRRLWRRYLIKDPRFVWLVMRTMADSRDSRVRAVARHASWTSPVRGSVRD